MVIMTSHAQWHSFLTAKPRVKSAHLDDRVVSQEHWRHPGEAIQNADREALMTPPQIPEATPRFEEIGVSQCCANCATGQNQPHFVT
eukprot:2515911-Amphidinium_carterae.1